MDEKETNRLEAFSDGVFAVAITLLILNIKIPDQLMDDVSLGQKLLAEWPMFVAYGTSFVTIGIMWLNHHRLFMHIKRTNTTLLLLNLLLLMVIVFIPVPTALLAEYLARPDWHMAAIVYSGTCVVMACCFNLLWRYASHGNRLLASNADPRNVEAISRQYAFGPLLYIIVFGLSWLNTLLCVVCSLVLALFFALPGPPPRLLAERGKRKGNKEE